MICKYCMKSSVSDICDTCKNDLEELSRKVKGKPPLGLEPKEVWNYKRMCEIIKAMDRYIQNVRKIPIEWVEEYNELVNSIDSRYLPQIEQSKEI